MKNHIAITNPGLGDLEGQVGSGGAGFLQSLIQVVIGLLFAVGFIYFFFMFLTGGIDWIRAGADKQQLEAARGKLVNAVIGLIILISAYAVVRLISTLLNVEILNPIIPTLSGGDGGLAPVGPGGSVNEPGDF